MKTVSILAILLVGFFFSFPQSRSSAKQVRVSAQQDKQKDRDEKEKDKSDSKVSGELGSKSNPVRCSGPRGERAYLNRLRCANGKAPEFYRLGSYGTGPYGNILDGYSVKCADAKEVTVFMDMYHDHIEKEAVPGFSIVNEEQKKEGQKSIAANRTNKSLYLTIP
ncbi:MAG TPA: hypothetical protein VGW12_14810 [Pyrinomonadaceae bacterium]|nr:hypothetical protein [Pyrinomonadaceae bacterium]